MRTTRRAFCKNWWNDRWLSLQSAFMSWLSAGESEIPIYSGDGGSFTLRVAAVSYLSPRSISEVHANPETERELDEEMVSPEDGDWLEGDLDAIEDGFHREGPVQ